MSIEHVDIERFWAKVDRTGGPDACWPWTGDINRGGYGEYRRTWGQRGSDHRRTRRWRAHRVAYELIVEPIPDGLQLDHLCRVRHCANPSHMEPVTAQENTMRGLAGMWRRQPGDLGETHCVNGHSWDDANTHIDSRGRRQCRACRWAASERWRDKQRAATP